MEKSGQVISFNVGGVKYLTSLSTLKAEPDNVLLKIGIGEIPSVKHKGYYFVDRNGSLFEHVLDYLRNVETWIPPGNVDLNALIREADFYLLFGMKEILEDHLAENEKVEIDPNYELRQATPIVLVTFESLKGPMFALHISIQKPILGRKDFFDGYGKDLHVMQKRLGDNCAILFRMGYRLVQQRGTNLVVYIFQSKD